MQHKNIREFKKSIREKLRPMKKAGYIHREKKRKKRKGTHSKNASKGQTKYKNQYRGQGR